MDTTTFIELVNAFFEMKKETRGKDTKYETPLSIIIHNRINLLDIQDEQRMYQLFSTRNLNGKSIGGWLANGPIMFLNYSKKEKLLPLEIIEPIIKRMSEVKYALELLSDEKYTVPAQEAIDSSLTETLFMYIVNLLDSLVPKTDKDIEELTFLRFVISYLPRLGDSFYVKLKGYNENSDTFIKGNKLIVRAIAKVDDEDGWYRDLPVEYQLKDHELQFIQKRIKEGRMYLWHDSDDPDASLSKEHTTFTSARFEELVKKYLPEIPIESEYARQIRKIRVNHGAFIAFKEGNSALECALRHVDDARRNGHSILTRQKNYLNFYKYLRPQDYNRKWFCDQKNDSVQTDKVVHSADTISIHGRSSSLKRTYDDACGKYDHLEKRLSLFDEMRAELDLDAFEEETLQLHAKRARIVSNLDQARNRKQQLCKMNELYTKLIEFHEE